MKKNVCPQTMSQVVVQTQKKAAGGRLCIFDSLKFLHGVDGAAYVGGGGHCLQALFVVGGNIERFNEGLDGCLVDAVFSAGELFEFFIGLLNAVFTHDGLDRFG